MKRITEALPVVLLLSTLFAAEARAQGTYTAANCNQSSVNAVINGPTHVAVDGDVINIPAGSCTWTSGITIPAGIGITIAGAGTPNSTPSTTGPSASCTQTVITDSGGRLFYLQPNYNSSLSRISCMKWNNSGSSGAPFEAAGTCNATTCPIIRVDNITYDASFQGITADSNSLNVTDNVFGVFDHNSAGGSPSGNWFTFETYNYSAWKGVGNYGDNSWASPNSFGTNQMIVMENNSWGGGIIISEMEASVAGNYPWYGGGRLAARFNNCNGCFSGASNHGTDSTGRNRGGRQIEFYGNTFLCGNPNGCQGGVPIRSGVNIMFGNSLTTYPNDIPYHTWFNQYMAVNAFRVNVIWGAPFNQCNGSGPYDDNTKSPPICIDQPGRSGGTLLSGNSPTPVGWVNQVIDPSYEWNDSGYNPVFGNVNSNYSGMIANRDWYTDNSLGTPHPQTSPTSPFNGTSGVGFGTLTNRPTTCTPRVGYWATDQGNWNQSRNSFGQGQLYVCSSTNTWTLYYMPYTYPHPLISGAAVATGTPPPSPTNLLVVIQ